MDLKALATKHSTSRKPGQERRTMSGGFIENASHTAEDAAKQLNVVFKCIATVAGATLQETKDIIDFFMTDRAADTDPTLELLGVEEERRLKCCAHIILGADAALEKVLLAYERKVGVGKLLQINNARFNNAGRSQSIFGRSQVALAKLLSPSHAINSISHYSQFCDYLKRKCDTKNPFKGYAFNRFGRVCKQAELFCEFKAHIKSYFAEEVDTSSNLLVRIYFVAASSFYPEITYLLAPF